MLNFCLQEFQLHERLSLENAEGDVLRLELTPGVDMGGIVHLRSSGLSLVLDGRNADDCCCLATARDMTTSLGVSSASWHALQHTIVGRSAVVEEFG